MSPHRDCCCRVAGGRLGAVASAGAPSVFLSRPASESPAVCSGASLRRALRLSARILARTGPHQPRRLARGARPAPRHWRRRLLAPLWRQGSAAAPVASTAAPDVSLAARAVGGAAVAAASAPRVAATAWDPLGLPPYSAGVATFVTAPPACRSRPPSGGTTATPPRESRSPTSPLPLLTPLPTPPPSAPSPLCLPPRVTPSSRSLLPSLGPAAPAFGPPPPAVTTFALSHPLEGFRDECPIASAPLEP